MIKWSLLIFFSLLNWSLNVLYQSPCLSLQQVHLGLRQRTSINTSSTYYRITRTCTTLVAPTVHYAINHNDDVNNNSNCSIKSSKQNDDKSRPIGDGTIVSRRQSLEKTSRMMMTLLHIPPILFTSTLSTTSFPQPSNAKQVLNNHGELFVIEDVNTYSALIYIPNNILKTSSINTDSSTPTKKYPVIFVLHGAGKNTNDIWNLADIKGEHAGLIPSLLNKNDDDDIAAPKELYENFIVVAPYSYNKTSFYNEPRSKILQFVKWVCNSDDWGSVSSSTIINGKDIIDQDRLFLFGFRHVCSIFDCFCIYILNILLELYMIFF